MKMVWIVCETEKLCDGSEQDGKARKQREGSKTTEFMYDLRFSFVHGVFAK